MQKIVLLFLVAASSLFGVEKNSMDCSNTPDWLMSEADKKYLCKDKNKVSKAKSNTAKSTQTGMVHSLDPNGDGFLSLRSKPKGRELGRLYNGDKVTILDTRGKWYKVKTADGQVGYAHSNWIRKTSSTATASNSSSSKTGVVTGLDPNGDGFLALRSKPKGREIGRLYNGDKVTILDKRGKWYKVKTASAGQIGWAHGNWIYSGKGKATKSKTKNRKKSYSKPRKRHFSTGDYVCSTWSSGKNGWCGYITQNLGNSVRVENYKVRCGSGGFLGVCTNISGGSCTGNIRLFVSDEYEARDNPRSLIVPKTCLD